MTRPLSCGVLVTDGTRLLLGHATRTRRWDIPKGMAEPGEAPEAAARRELLEETGLTAPIGSLVDLGIHAYRPNKDLALFSWRRPELPDPATLRCSSLVGTGPAAFAEFDRFIAADWGTAIGLIGRSLAATLGPVMAACGASVEPPSPNPLPGERASRPSRRR